MMKERIGDGKSSFLLPEQEEKKTPIPPKNEIQKAVEEEVREKSLMMRTTGFVPKGKIFKVKYEDKPGECKSLKPETESVKEERIIIPEEPKIQHEKVLEIFYSDKKIKLTIKEVSELTSISVSSVGIVLSHIYKSGILKKESFRDITPSGKISLYNIYSLQEEWRERELKEAVEIARNFRRALDPRTRIGAGILKREVISEEKVAIPEESLDSIRLLGHAISVLTKVKFRLKTPPGLKSIILESAFPISLRQEQTRTGAWRLIATGKEIIIKEQEKDHRES